MNALMLSKIVEQLLLPPGGLILLGGLGVVFWRRVWGRLLVVFSLSLFWLLSTEPVRDILLEPLEQKFPAVALSLQPEDEMAIVLLGGGLYEKAPEYGGSDQLGPYSLRRTVYAADLAIQSKLPIYTSGGHPLSQQAGSEGGVMGRWLRRLGVPADSIDVETASNTTWENAERLAPMLEQAGIRKVVLVTSAWHMPRSVWCFTEHGFEVIPAPADYLREAAPYDARSYFPRWNVLNESVLALHEYLGIFWYRFAYG